MKFKDIIKSSGFKSVVVLLVICLVCVGLLAVLNDLLYVSDDVMFERAMKKIYDKPGVSFTPTSVQSAHANSPYGKVNSVTMAKQGGSDVAAVVEATGINGYAGTITCYVVISNQGKIEAWSIKSFTGETLMSSFGSKHFETWYIGADVSDEIAMGSNMVSGVTMSSRAINNAINAAGYYSRNALGFGKNPQAEAMATAVELLAETEFADIEFAGVSKSPYNHLGADLTYVFSGTKGDDTVMAFAYTIGGNVEFIIINASYDDAVRSNVLAQTDGITSEITDAVTGNYFNSVARLTDVSGNVYTVTGYALGMAPIITFEITIEGGAVTKIDATSALTQDYSDSAVVLQSFVGATLTSIDGINLSTGATNSNKVIYNAVLTALNHYAANNG